MFQHTHFFFGVCRWVEWSVLMACRRNSCVWARCSRYVCAWCVYMCFCSLPLRRWLCGHVSLAVCRLFFCFFFFVVMLRIVVGICSFWCGFRFRFQPQAKSSPHVNETMWLIQDISLPSSAQYFRDYFPHEIRCCCCCSGYFAWNAFDITSLAFSDTIQFVLLERAMRFPCARLFYSPIDFDCI